MKNVCKYLQKQKQLIPLVVVFELFLEFIADFPHLPNFPQELHGEGAGPGQEGCCSFPFLVNGLQFLKQDSKQILK